MSKEKSNLDLWNRVEKTDPKHTKKANVKGNNLTSIKPQYQIYNATKEWGSYGSTWGFKNIELGFELKDVGLITFKATFYYPSGEFETLNTISFWRDNAQTKLDDEFAKKVETDSLTKCLSKLGFNADVFMGRFDDLRYVEEVKKEFNRDADEVSKQKEKDRFLNFINNCTDIEKLKEVQGWVSKQNNKAFTSLYDAKVKELS
jgi:hypothetical protein